MTENDTKPTFDQRQLQRYNIAPILGSKGNGSEFILVPNVPFPLRDYNLIVDIYVGGLNGFQHTDDKRLAWNTKYVGVAIDGQLQQLEIAKLNGSLDAKLAIDLLQKHGIKVAYFYTHGDTTSGEIEVIDYNGIGVSIEAIIQHVETINANNRVKPYDVILLAACNEEGLDYPEASIPIIAQRSVATTGRFPVIGDDGRLTLPPPNNYIFIGPKSKATDR